jgi:hypothetical protein
VSQDVILLHWDGTDLLVHSFGPFSNDREFIGGIWASSPFDVWVAGGTPIGAKVSHFDGAAWTEFRLPGGDAELSESVWGWCPTGLWAVGDDRIWRFDATSWTLVSTKRSPLASVSGTGFDDAWISGPSGFSSVVLHWQKNICGDQEVGPGEECDPPRPLGTSDVPVCDQTCHIPTCGNLTLDPGETCDPPNDTTCDRQCQSIPIVCGNGILQPGEDCEYASTDLCRDCHLTTCGGCFEANFGEQCRGLSLDDTPSCYALVGCMANDYGACTKPWGGLGCYCGGPSCGTSATGICASQFEALAHSHDPAVVTAQISDQTTPVGKATTAVVAFGISHCGMYCPPR